MYVCLATHVCSLSVRSCKKFSKAEKHFRVHRMPKVLTLHLKRLVFELNCVIAVRN